MPDLNKLLSDAQKQGKAVRKDLERLLITYETLYREGHNRYVAERTATTDIEGLEDFYILLQTIRRNRDVVGSLVRGLHNVRSMEKYSFVEEETPKPQPKKKEPKISSRKIEELRIPEEPVTETVSGGGIVNG